MTPTSSTSGPSSAAAADVTATQSVSVPATALTRQTWTPDAVRLLGMTTDLPTAAAILGIGRTLAFDLARTGQFPVRLIRLGRRVLVPVPELLQFLGVPSATRPDADAS